MAEIFALAGPCAQALSRQRAGGAVLRVEVDDLTPVTDFLADGGFLPPWGSNARTEVAKAVATALGVFSRR
jgi:hypothetical protein